MAGKGVSSVPCLPRQTWHADAATIADHVLRHRRRWHLLDIFALSICFLYHIGRILEWDRSTATKCAVVWPAMRGGSAALTKGHRYPTSLPKLTNAKHAMISPHALTVISRAA